MLAALRIIRKKGGVLVTVPTRTSVSREEAIELQRYLDKKEMPIVGKMRGEICDNLAEHLASIQYDLLEISDFGLKGVAWPSLDNERMYLSAAYRYEISVYHDYVV